MVARSKLLAIALGLALVACVDSPGFQCLESAQCQSGNAVGTCEATGFCSFVDSSCGSGRRYGGAAGSLSDRCTDAVGDADASLLVDGDVDGGVAIDGGAGDAMTSSDAITSSDAEPADAAAAAADAGDIIVDFTPTNIPSALLTSATNSLTLQASDGVVEIDSDTGAITRLADFADLHPIGVGFTKVNQGAGEPDIGILSLTALDIADGVTVRIVGEAALALAVAGDVTIAGVVDNRGGRGSADLAGAGGFGGGALSSCDGVGIGGGGAVSSGDDVGGGGGGHVAGGGSGGDRAATAGGAGGDSYAALLSPLAFLSPLIGGSGGACGGGAAPRGAGGGGGGAVQISARGTLRIFASGVINVGGGGGAGGGNDNGGGGGGSGGAVLIEAGRIVIFGVVAANGGGGGGGGDRAASGSAGAAGGASALAAAGGGAAGEGAGGGDGGAGASATGQVGAATTGVSGSDNAGGGGGAAGRIRLRSDDIQRPGVVSPIVGLSESGM